jgi:hypothetical protein
MSGTNKTNNVMAMFSRGTPYTPHILTRTNKPNSTGMRAYFQRQANAAKSLDPATIRAALTEKGTGGPMKKGGKRRSTRRRRSSRRH